jgi:hypothetical protein
MADKARPRSTRHGRRGLARWRHSLSLRDVPAQSETKRPM